MKYTEFENTLKDLFPEISQDQLDKFKALEDLYKDWNAKINVISRKDIDQIYKHHILHSLGIALYLRYQLPQEYENMTGELLDLGCGGGFPGIPLAILFPNAKFTLCDSIGKKITVAKEVAKALKLENVTTINARAESLDKKFDWVVSRAVTSLENFLPWVRGKYKKGILYLKGGDLSEEIALAMGREKLPPKTVHNWGLDCILKDEFFVGKKVIFIEKYFAV